MTAAFVISNIIIAVAYVSFYVAPRLTIVGMPGGALVAKWAILIFFFCCATTHAELAYHAATEPQVGWVFSWHMVVDHVVQAAAAIVGVGFTARFLHIYVDTTKK